MLLNIQNDLSLYRYGLEHNYGGNHSLMIIDVGSRA